MAMRKILVDETNRELCEHGTVGFPMTVNHDDLWAFEGKSVPIHWHNDLEISLPREGEAIYQVYRKSYTVRPGDVLLLNRNVPHSCHSPNNDHACINSAVPSVCQQDWQISMPKQKIWQKSQLRHWRVLM